MADPKNKRPSRPTPPVVLPATPDPHGDTTARTELSPELLSSLREERRDDRRDESERVTVRRRIVIGPDGAPRVLDDEDDETTRRISIKPPDEE